MKYIIIILLSVFFHTFSAFSSSFEEFLDALKQVESGGNNRAIGDGGRSIGPYQITKLYFIDAQKQEGRLRNNKYLDCFDPVVAEIVVRAYMRKYEREAFRKQDWEIISKCHNGGPNWRNKNQIVKNRLEKYWEKIKVELNRLK